MSRKIQMFFLRRYCQEHFITKLNMMQVLHRKGNKLLFTRSIFSIPYTSDDLDLQNLNRIIRHIPAFLRMA